MSLSTKRSRASLDGPEPLRKRTRLQAREHQAFFPFLRLPPEIRLMIYSLCGLNLEKSLTGVIAHDSHTTTPSVLLVNRQIYYEARKVLKRFENLELTIPQRQKSFEPIICIPALGRLQHLSLVIHHPSSSTEAEQFWPWKIAHSTNTVEQLYQWTRMLREAWKLVGHNLKSFKMHFENDRVSQHLRLCHHDCQVRRRLRQMLEDLRSVRGIEQVELTGNVLEHYEEEIQETRKKLMQPKLLAPFSALPLNVLSQIVSFVVARPDHVRLWKEFEAPVWSEISRKSLSREAETASRKKSVGTTRNGRASTKQHTGSAQVECFSTSQNAISTAQLSPSITNAFRSALVVVPRQYFSSPALFRASRRVNELCNDVVTGQTLVFDQPFFPLSLSGSSRQMKTMKNCKASRTLSPFITDQYLQAVRDVVLEYQVSFERNWLWIHFVDALAKLWSKRHRLHTLTLRISDPNHELNEKARRAAVVAFETLNSLRGVHILVLDGPFKQSEKWKLEKMLLNSKMSK